MTALGDDAELERAAALIEQMLEGVRVMRHQVADFETRVSGLERRLGLEGEGHER